MRGPSRLVFHSHALKRMFERRVSVEAVRHVVEVGETIEEYPVDLPYTGHLILAVVGRRPLHVVAAHNTDADETIIITVYEPDAALWESGFRRRQRP